jgi:hypothetical protein
MFSAVSVPPCASAICRLIDRPRPEFWPKALAFRPVGVEALEDAVDVVGLDAGTIVLDGDDARLPARASDTVILAMVLVGTKERAFSIRLVMTWPMRRSWPLTTRKRVLTPGLRSTLELDLDFLLAARIFRETSTRSAAEFLQVDGSRHLRGQARRPGARRRKCR